MSFRILETDGWAGLYVDGKFFTAGPTYWVEERLQQLMEVERTFFDEMVFQEETDFPATLEEALTKQEAFEDAQDSVDEDEEKLAKAQELEAEAQALRKQVASRRR